LNVLIMSGIFLASQGEDDNSSQRKLRVLAFLIDKKLIKKFLLALLFVAVLLTSIIAMRKEIVHVYNSQRYKEEVIYVKKYLHIIVTEDEEKIRKVFTSNSLWRDRGGEIYTLKALLSEIYAEKIKIRNASKKFEDNREVCFIEIYFSNDLRTSININLVKDEEWLIHSITLSDEAFTLLKERGLIDKNIIM